MMDLESESLWSHILGRAMQGKLVGKHLESIPSDIVTWASWKQDYPESTVLAMRRTKHRSYTNQFYQNPLKFVVGMVVEGAHHCSFGTLVWQPLLNVEVDGSPFVISFDAESTSVRIFSRKIDGDRVLTFVANDQTIRDEQTNSTWDRATGFATNGPLRGTQLTAQVGIVSYARAWSEFHPKSRELKRVAD
jgi:hypothetical protein